MLAKSDAAFTHNERDEMPADKKIKQDLALAYAIKRKAQGKSYADGGSVLEEEDPKKKFFAKTIMGGILGDTSMGKMYSTGYDLKEFYKYGKSKKDPANPSELRVGPSELQLGPEDEEEELPEAAMYEGGEVEADKEKKDLASRVMRRLRNC